MVKSFVKTSDKRMKLVYKKVIEPQLGNLIDIGHVLKDGLFH